MRLVRAIKEKIKLYPRTYDVLIRIYSLYTEVKFLFHAIFTGKLFIKYDRHKFSEFLSKQKILTYQLPERDLKTADDFRQWLKKNKLQYTEGGWTFYIPPQKELNKYFNFLINNYPPDSGLKILKDFNMPEKAKYTNHKQNPADGSTLKRSLTFSPVSLLRVANYLYAYRLGVRVYDLIEIKMRDCSLTCYIVQHVEGGDVQQKDYDSFMGELRSLFDLGDITTIHENTDMMHDFKPPNCSNNLIMSSKYGRPIYLDFQGFLLKDEEKIINRIINDIKNTVHFGDVRLYRGREKYLYQSIPGLAVGKRDVETRGRFFIEMMAESQCAVDGRAVYDIGCNTGLLLYKALSIGAQWGIGWDFPNVVQSAERVLLALGATRFDLFGGEITEKTDFISNIPPRYKTKNDGILFYLAVSNHLGFPDGIADLPWEYMFYEGHVEQGLEVSLNRLQSVPWLRNTRVLSHRSFADGDSLKRVVILLKRETG